jgi:ribosomal-protein-alanine N-acetyltransferase
VAVQVALAGVDERAAIAQTARLCRIELDPQHASEPDWARLWVARLDPADPRVAGLLLAWAVADEMHIIDLATRPDCRRRGVARSLLAALLDHARAHRVRLVLLEVRRSNTAALRLYAAAGFSAAGVRPRYYSDPVEDALLMKLALAPSAETDCPRRTRRR